MESYRQRAVLGKVAVSWVITGVLVLLGMEMANAQRGPLPPGGSTRLVRVAAAADLKFALDDLSAVFRTQHPDITVHVSYGSSGTFFAQLSNRAPFDIFFSADVDYPRQLIATGL